MRSDKGYGCGKNKMLWQHGRGEAQTDRESWSRTAFKGQVGVRERTCQEKGKSVAEYGGMKQAVAHGLVGGRGN